MSWSSNLIFQAHGIPVGHRLLLANLHAPHVSNFDVQQMAQSWLHHCIKGIHSHSFDIADLTVLMYWQAVNYQFNQSSTWGKNTLSKHNDTIGETMALNIYLYFNNNRDIISIRWLDEFIVPQSETGICINNIIQ